MVYVPTWASTTAPDRSDVWNVYKLPFLVKADPRPTSGSRAVGSRRRLMVLFTRNPADFEHLKGMGLDVHTV